MTGVPQRQPQAGQQAGRSRIVVLRRRSRLSRTGRAPVSIRCASATTCRGTLRLYRFVTRGDQPVARLTLGRRSFRIGAGRTATVRVLVPRTQRRVVSRRRQVRMVASAVARFGDGTQGRAYVGLPLLRRPR